MPLFFYFFYKFYLKIVTLFFREYPFAEYEEFINRQDIHLSEEDIMNPAKLQEIKEAGFKIIGKMAYREEFKTQEIKQAIIESNLRPQLPSNCPAFYSNLICFCWKHNPQKRIQLEVVINTLAKELTKLGIARTPPPMLNKNHQDTLPRTQSPQRLHAIQTRPQARSNHLPLSKVLIQKKQQQQTQLVQFSETVKLPSGILSFTRFSSRLLCGCKDGKVYLVDMKVLNLVSDA